MAENGGGGPDAQKRVHGDQEGLPEATGRHASPHQREKEAEGGAPLGETDDPDRIHFFITARRVRIDPVKKREQYIERLERLLVHLDHVISSAEVSEKLKLQAMNVLISTVRTCYGIISDIEVEGLENELKRITEENQREEAERKLGYDIEEDPAE
jgi:hypothetical protein